MLNAPGRPYGKILIERVHKIIEGKISEEREEIRMGTGCLDQISSLCLVIKKILAK